MAGHGKRVDKRPAHRSASRWAGPGFKFVLGVAAFYAIFFGSWHAYHQWPRDVRLEPSKAAYFHYEFIELRLRGGERSLRERWKASPPRAVVKRDGAVVPTVGGITEVPLVWDEARQAFSGKWPCPWNAPAGRYSPELLGEPNLGDKLKVRSFRIEYRKPRPLPRRFVVLTMETIAPLATLKIKGPDGAQTGWEGLLDWVKYVEADAFWILAGQTPGKKPGETWVAHNLQILPQIAKEAHRRGLKFGVWAMCYLTMSKEPLSRYRYAMDVTDGKPVPTRAISIADPKRPDDVADFLRTFRDVPEVDFLGLDYIRNALGGYELVDEFVAEMPGLRLPEEWHKLTRDERMVWLARKKIMRKDPAFIDAWQWWRAHRVALIVRRIRERLGDSKALWAFTLTWEKGWHHGQDPVMMNDAGIDADSLMLYEANAAQFGWMVRDWHTYVRTKDVQLIVGDVVDWPLHQKSEKGPGEMVRRLSRASTRIYKDGPAAGIFIHDLARGLWGRLGPYSSLEWMNAARDYARAFRALPDAAGKKEAAKSAAPEPVGLRPPPPEEGVRTVPAEGAAPSEAAR
ncbi:MAG: hypothetical protein HY078_15835 [Elusimicrobia bacterium]|nr:hypothetical protein [Elusimicrobiota bacterium]